ncbi:ferredoxin [Streptomyces sp. H39-S7]|uniref:ferredoxin n=1 Tax=Streptomyces sp. H39-S7 TaxID=3004357 RepID=UPI0022AF6F6B|nr:ferredoxin [Streptomyces sp. H39-S7]MCZ4121823.1 ferredoxin [Streptomyces sp. H39-S7]
MGSWHVEVDHRVCMGAGLCNGNLPDRFELVDAKSIPVAEWIEPDEDVLDAADYCPYRAIRITDKTTGETLSAGD